MRTALYKLREVEAIARLTAEFTGGNDSRGMMLFLSRLALHFQANLCGIVQLERDTSTASLIGFAQDPARVPQWPEVQRALSRLWEQSGATGVKALDVNALDGHRLLCSVIPVTPRKLSVLLLHRQQKRFDRRAALSLPMIHSIVEPRLARSFPIAFPDTQTMPPRLQQVQTALLDGLSEKQIAHRLQLSPHTVHVHVKHLYKRRRVNSRAELMSACFRQQAESIEEQMRFGRRQDQIPRRELQQCLQYITSAVPIDALKATAGRTLLGTPQPPGQPANTLAKLMYVPFHLGSAAPGAAPIAS
jgi:hypothetical protein